MPCSVKQLWMSRRSHSVDRDTGRLDFFFVLLIVETVSVRMAMLPRADEVHLARTPVGPSESPAGTSDVVAIRNVSPFTIFAT